MLHKTRGIVFHAIEYGETSLIVSIFTETLGLQKYIVNGARGKSAKNKIALYQPLTLLTLVVYHRENANIQRIKEADCSYAYRHILTDPVKGCLTLFIQEILNKTVREQSHPEVLFDFIFSSLIALDEATGHVENFHLIFLIKLSHLLGFGPQSTRDFETTWATGSEEDKKLQILLTANYTTSLSLKANERKAMLEALVRFYATHADSFGEIKSINVLREVLHR